MASWESWIPISRAATFNNVHSPMNDVPKLHPQLSLPKVLLLKPPPVFRHFEAEFSLHFDFLKAYESPHSTHHFLDSANATGVSAMFVNNSPQITAAGMFRLSGRLGGKAVGLVGFGNIGSKIARRLEAFDCRLQYNARTKKDSVPYSFYSDVRELAANSDILVVCCPLTHQTRHIINKEVLTALGNKGVIINVARGAVVDEEVLVSFLKEGQIAGAGLDVYEHEPSVPKELFGLNNVVLSPHQASFTEEAFLDLYEHVKGNLQAFFANKPLLSPVL